MPGSGTPPLSAPYLFPGAWFVRHQRVVNNVSSSSFCQYQCHGLCSLCAKVKWLHLGELDSREPSPSLNSECRMLFKDRALGAVNIPQHFFMSQLSGRLWPCLFGGWPSANQERSRLEAQNSPQQAFDVTHAAYCTRGATAVSETTRAISYLTHVRLTLRSSCLSPLRLLAKNTLCNSFRRCLLLGRSNALSTRSLIFRMIFVRTSFTFYFLQVLRPVVRKTQGRRREGQFLGSHKATWSWLLGLGRGP